MTQVTKLEMEVIEEVCFGDHSSDGNGIGTWFEYGYMNTEWLKKARGAMSSLVQKGVIIVDTQAYEDLGLHFEKEYKGGAWVSVVEKHQRKCSDEEYESSEEGSIERWTGYTLVGIEQEE